jgi:hypothetical protein
MFSQFENLLFDQVIQVTRLESTVADLGLRIQQGFADSRHEQLQSTRLQIEEQEGRTRDQIDGIRRHTESSIGELRGKMDEMNAAFASGLKKLTDAFVSKPAIAPPAPAPSASAPSVSFAPPITVPITPAPPSRPYFSPPSRASDIPLYAPRWSMPPSGTGMPSPLSQSSHSSFASNDGVVRTSSRSDDGRW